MTEWTKDDDSELITLAKRNLSVEEIHRLFPGVSEGSISARLNTLRKQGHLPKRFKIRMQQWDEDAVISLANKGLTASEIAGISPKTTVGVVIGRLTTLKNEGKLPKNYIIRTGKKQKVVKEPITEKTQQIELFDEQNLARDPDNNNSKIYLDLSSRLSKLEAELVSNSRVSDSYEATQQKTRREISQVSADVNVLKRKVEGFSHHEMDPILKSISDLERKIIKVEAVMGGLQQTLDSQKKMWDSFRQAVEHHGSSELITIVRDAENIAINRK
jgi:hypothetical protein